MNTIKDNRALRIALAPELLTAVVRSGKKVVAHSEVRIAAAAPDGCWDNALAAFEAYLRQAGRTLRGVPISVSITTRWCRLSMLPWSDALLDRDGARRHALAHFEAIYGAAAHQWTVVCADAPQGQARLACAVDRAFLAGLRKAAFDNGNSCVLAESVLSIASRAIAGGAHEAIAVIEPGHLVLATLEQGRITGVQAHAGRAPWHVALPRAWEGWMRRAGQLQGIANVAVVSLDEGAAGAALPAPFYEVALPAALAPSYAAVTMMGC